VPFGNGRLCLGWRLRWESDPVAIKSFVIYQGKEFALRAWEVISVKVLGSGQGTEPIVVCLHSNKELVKYVINGK